MIAKPQTAIRWQAPRQERLFAFDIRRKNETISKNRFSHFEKGRKSRVPAPETSAKHIDLLPFPARPGRHLRIGITGHHPHSGHVFEAGAVNRAFAAVFTDIEAWFAG
jgi:hypothetical protein